MIRQQWNVFAALAQVGHADGNHTEAIVEILAELISATKSLSRSRLVGGDNPHIDGNLTGAATGRTVRSCSTRSSFHLHGQRHLTDFVQEDGAAPATSNRPRLFLIGR